MGREEFLELAAASQADDSFGETQALFESSFGTSFEALADDYIEAYPVCDKTYFRDDSFDCDRNVVRAPGPGDEQLELEVSLECDEPEVLGPRAGERWTMLTLEVPVKAYYGLYVSPTDASLLRAGQVRVRRCGSSCFDEPQPVNTDPVRLSGWDGSWDTADEYCLEPGRYTFRLSLWENEASTFRFVVWPARVAESCS